MSFPDLKVAEYIASSCDFPNLRSGFGSGRGVVFYYPRDVVGDYNETRRGGFHYLFETSNLILTDGMFYTAEAKRFNQLLSNAKNDGFAFLVITAEGSWRDTAEIVQKLLNAYDAGNWYPEPPDTYHDSGYFYSDGYVKKTPVFAYIEQQLQNSRPAIYMDSRTVMSNISNWVERRRTQDPSYPYRKGESSAS